MIIEFLLYVVVVPAAVVVALTYSVRRHLRRRTSKDAEVRMPPVSLGGSDGPFGNNRS